MAKPKKIPDGLFANFAHMSTDQITAYLDKQGIATTKHWSELWEEANAHAKTITGETRVNLINDVFNGVRAGLEQGKGSTITAKEIAQSLAKKGWFYGARGGALYSDDIDNAKALKGSVHRLKIIARQNMQSAYMAGRWSRFEANRKNRPYLQYIAVRDDSSRPPHAAMHGRIFHIDDPIWDIIWPPNGFNCRCRVRALSAKDLKRKGLSVSESHIEKEDVIIRKADENGNAEIVKYRYKVKADDSESSMNVDAGFAYNGGKEQAKPFIPRMGEVTVENAHLLERVGELDKILPAGLSDETYADAFLAKFGIERGQTSYLTDVAGETLPISDDLLKNRQTGEWKIEKGGRGRYLPLLAETFLNPDEIWMNWEQEPNSKQWVLRRYYLNVMDIATDLYGFGVFSRDSNNDWYGSTIFHRAQRSREEMMKRLNNRRRGVRVYKKKSGATPTDT